MSIFWMMKQKGENINKKKECFLCRAFTKQVLHFHVTLTKSSYFFSFKYIYVHIYTHIHMYTHTYTHTHIHTCSYIHAFTHYNLHLYTIIP